MAFCILQLNGLRLGSLAARSAFNDKCNNMEFFSYDMFPVLLLGQGFSSGTKDTIRDFSMKQHKQHFEIQQQEITKCEDKANTSKMITEIEEDEECIPSLSKEKTPSSGCADELAVSVSRIAADVPAIPTYIIGSIIAPMIASRCTFENLAATCKDVREYCMTMNALPPWPETLLHVGSSSVWSVAFSPDGNLLAAGRGDGRIRLYDRRKGPLPLLEAHAARVYSIVFDPNCLLMVSGSGECDI
jgi:hypothetical protein